MKGLSERPLDKGPIIFGPLFKAGEWAHTRHSEERPYTQRISAVILGVSPTFGNVNVVRMLLIFRETVVFDS